MQIRLTVLGSRGGRPRDVLVTAPEGTRLAAVTAALAATGPGGGARGGRTPTQVTVYAGAQLVPQDALVGHPPLLEGAVLHLHAPEAAEPVPELSATAPGTPVLRVVGGPDTGGVHLLRSGSIRVGRSAEADIPLDDPDVSRTHLLLEVEESRPGTAPRVTVRDPGSTNGTALDGRGIGPDPVPLLPGALLQLGESALVLTESRTWSTRTVAPDGHGRLRLVPAARSGAPRAAPPLTPGTPPPRPPDDGPPPAPPLADGPQRLPATRRPPGRLGRGFSLQRFAAAARAGGLWRSAARRGAAARRPDDPAAALLERARGLRQRWPDQAELLLTAIGRGPRLWERHPGHPDELCIRLGTADLALEEGLDAYEEGDLTAALPAVPITVDLREVGVLGLAGPRRRLTGLARSVLAQLAALHSPQHLELVVLSLAAPVDTASTPSARSAAPTPSAADQDTGSTAARAAAPQAAAEDWAWTRWLPHLLPAREQSCRLLVGTDPEQIRARLGELAARMDEPAFGATGGRHTVVLLDAPAAGRPAYEAELDRLITDGPAAGILTVCLAEHPSELPSGCSMWAELGGEVATHLRLRGPDGAAPERISTDAVSAVWAERFARALAPLREGAAPAPGEHRLPDSVRLLDSLGLEQITPSRIAERWSGLRAASRTLPAVLGTDSGGACAVDLAGEGPHLLIGGAPGSGRTELLRSLVASLAVADRPDRLSVLLVQGSAPDAPLAARPGLLGLTDLPHVSAFLDTRDAVRTRDAAHTLLEELNRRRARFGEGGFLAQRPESLQGAGRGARSGGGGVLPVPAAAFAAHLPAQALPASGAGTPRLLVVVDDLDVLLSAPGGAAGGTAGAAPGRTGPVPGESPETRKATAALLHALDSVARHGGRLGIHLVAAVGRPELLSGTEIADAAALRISLRAADALSSRLLIHVEDAAVPASPGAGPSGGQQQVGRGWLRRPDGAVTAFQTGRISGRIPRTATLRPTAVALDWRQMGAPAQRRPVREIGNGPTDLALLASALQRAAEAADADPVPPLFTT